MRGMGLAVVMRRTEPTCRQHHPCKPSSPECGRNSSLISAAGSAEELITSANYCDKASPFSFYVSILACLVCFVSVYFMAGNTFNSLVN